MIPEERTPKQEPARKGGETVSQDRSHMADIGRKGGESRSSPADGEEPPVMPS